MYFQLSLLMKIKFSIANILYILLITSVNIISQSNYTSQTISELETLRNNVENAEIQNDSLAIARAYYKLALKYDYIDENDSCDLYYKKAIYVAKKIKNVRAEAIISNALATSISDRGLHQESIEIYNQIVKLFFSEKDTSGAAGVILNTAAEYSDMGEYEKAVNLSLKALNLKLAASDSTNIAGYYKQIASIFQILDNQEKWEEYILLANSIAMKNEKYGGFYIRMDILNQLGAYYFNKNNFDLAKKYYNTLYTESTKRDYLSGITSASSNLVTILKKDKKYNEALVLSKKALALSHKAEKPYKIIHNLEETAKLEIILNRKNKAKERLLEAKKISQKYNFPTELISIYKILAELNFDNGNFMQAYQNLEKHLTLKDSIEGAKTKQIIAELDTKYQTEKKDNQIKLLNQENLIQEEKITFQNRTVIGLILLVILSITLFVLFYIQHKLKTQNRILNMHQKLLRSQMNPHFIFNALIAIQNFVLKNKKFEASDYLSQFATLMRTILNSSREDFSTLKNEIEMLEYYVSLQQLLFENSFNFILEVDEKINSDELQIPPMVIQPFIENAIEHGLRGIEEDEKNLLVKYVLNKNNMQIIIRDNGKGINHKNKNIQTNKHHSHAMEITQERLMNITKIYKENIDISIRDLSEFEEITGTEITFTFPLNLLKKNRND